MRILSAIGVLLALCGCGSKDRAPHTPDGAAAAPVIERETEADESSVPSLDDDNPLPTAPLVRGQEIAVPEGVVLVGSRPGDPTRDPSREADLVPVRVSAFHIDRLPHPNDPASPPTTGVTLEEAAAACETEGKRLCNELEWERACKGGDERDYPGGHVESLEDCLIDPGRCASPFDVIGMGVEAYEWTASPVTRGLGSARYSSVVRGARASDPLAEHRCGARHALDPTSAEPDATFRCCRGPLPEASYPAEEGIHPFRDRPVEPEELRHILSSIPELARFAPRFELFDAEAIDAALAAGDVARDGVPWTMVEGMLAWSPEHGEEALLFAGGNGEATLVAVIHPMPDGSYTHGSSFVITGEDAPPVALGWDYGQRRQVLWATAWGRAGESGVIEHRDDHRIVIVQR